MKKSRFILVSGLVVLSLSLLVTQLPLAACSHASTDLVGVAATVNGTAIMEQDVTDQIEAMRLQGVDYTDPATWASAFAASGQTPESLRANIINGMIRDVLITQEATAQGFSVDDTVIESQIALARDTTGAQDEAAWLEMLQASGYRSEQVYRESLEVNYLQLQLYASFTIEPTEAELRDYIARNPAAVEGFSLLNTAAEEPPGEPAEEAQADDTDFATAEDELVGEEPEASDPEPAPAVVSLTAADIDLNAIPEVYLARYKELWIDYNKGLAFQVWIQDLIANADIVIYDMPADVPYNVVPNSTATGGEPTSAA